MSQARARVDEWAAASLLLLRGAAPRAELLAELRPWLDATLDTIALPPPLGVVADLGRLLTRAPFDLAASVPVSDPELRRAVDGYEEQLLGQLAGDLTLEEARDALARLPPRSRPTAIAVFVEQVLARVHRALPARELDGPGPAALRRALRRPPEDLLALAAETLDAPARAALRAELARDYAHLARGARQCGGLIGDLELLTLENHSALHRASARLAVAQIADTAAELEARLPLRVRRRQASRGRTPTRVEDESAYPIGGYASLSTVGGIESLVSSELIYMTSVAERQAGEVDLFDLRWATGELLKYTRDESVHTRPARSISFVLDPGLDRARVKDSEAPVQRIVLALAAMIACIRKLAAWLDATQLRLSIVLLADETGGQPLRSEGELCRLILRSHIEAKTVDILEVASLDQARGVAEAARGSSDLIWLLGPGQMPRLPGADPENLREHALAGGEAQPRLWTELSRNERSTRELTVRETAQIHAWAQVIDELLQALI